MSVSNPTGASAPTQAAARQIENTIPILAVADMKVSQRFYQQTLEFTLDWGAGSICSVSRDGCPIMLMQDQRPSNGTWVWIGCEDVQILYAQFMARGAKIVQPPTNQGYALEMKVQDPDGHILWFGSEPLKDTPFGQQPATE